MSNKSINEKMMQFIDDKTKLKIAVAKWISNWKLANGVSKYNLNCCWVLKIHSKLRCFTLKIVFTCVLTYLSKNITFSWQRKMCYSISNHETIRLWKYLFIFLLTSFEFDTKIIVIITHNIVSILFKPLSQKF